MATNHVCLQSEDRVVLARRGSACSLSTLPNSSLCCFNSAPTARFRTISITWVVALVFFVDFAISSATFPESEYFALYDLYNATNGADWVWSDDSQAGIPWVFSANANPCSDHWQGVNCSVDFSPSPPTFHVTKLQLDKTNLQGYLAESLSDLVELQLLSLAANSLWGTIPPEYCTFGQLAELSFEENRLHGPVPDCITGMASLQYLLLNRNRLTGTIPRAIGNLTELLYLNLAFNRLHGRIPPSIGNQTLLVELSLPYNRLTGPIPSSLGSLTQLQDLFLQGNLLSGAIPSSIYGLSQLRKLALHRNHLTGHIAGAIGDLTHLQWLFLYRNKLSGSIPSTLGSLVQLMGISLEGNRLTGTIPHTVGNLGQLLGLSLHSNELEGPIPNTIGNLTHLLGLNLRHNGLTGTVPSSIGNLVYMLELLLERNSLTGTLPESLGRLVHVLGMSLEVNQLTGPLPQAVGNLTQVLELTLYDNKLSGTIPTTIGLLSNLATLSLKGNQMTGPLGGRFRTSQDQLIAIQLDDNQFTGELPADFFALPALASLSMVGSCLHGALPSNICNATQLEALILYGLTTGSTCRARGVQSLSLVQSRQTFAGPFPACLLQLPQMVTLLMSSNGLTGSIPSVPVSHKLLELDLCHNDLTGPIPNTIQNHSWKLLDLSYNKFNGVLQADMLRPLNITLHKEIHHLFNVTFSPELHTVVSLESNRLSGPVPNALVPLRNLSVLAGNLFTCRYDKIDLPQHDEDITNYECASNTFDVAIYVWLIVSAGALLVVLTVYRSQPLLLVASMMQLPDEYSGRLSNLYSLLEEYNVLARTGWASTAFCLVVLMPYYAVMSYYDGTHTYQYAYMLSAIYISGVLPFVLDVLLLALVLWAVYASFLTRYRAITAASAPVEKPTHAQWNRTYVWLIFSFVNITVVLGANVAFVYVVLYQSSAIQTLAQIFLSLFKLTWSMVASPYMIGKLRRRFSPDNDGPQETYFTLQLLVALFNNIAIPCLVVAAIDPNCFSNILLPPDLETVEYLSPQCVPFVDDGACQIVKYQRSTLQFTPPFTYSYQCSASIITSYAPTFIYMSLSTVFLTPLLQYVLVWLYDRYPAGSTVNYAVSLVLPSILALPESEAAPALNGRRKRILGGVGTLVTVLTQVAILLTFGVIFPPIALAMAVSTSAVVVMTAYKARRFVLCAIQKQFFGYLDTINAECEGLGSAEQMRVAQIMLLCYCCAFYTLFLFDTLGDAVGFDASVWVLIVFPVMPFALFANGELLRRYGFLRQPESLASKSGKTLGAEEMGIELSVASAFQYPDKQASSGVGADDRDLSAAAVTANVLHASAV